MIIDYRLQHPDEGYRRLTYMMLDADVVAVSSSSVYRVLKCAGLMASASQKPSKKGKGFDQPTRPHQHWHIDITYINICGTFYYLCALLDGYSRYIVHWEIREQMTESDVEIIIQRARERFPGVYPRIISDNGPQFIAREFKVFVKLCGMTHVRTSPFYPQSNGKLERWNGSLKRECIRPKTPTSLAEAQCVVAEFVNHYNLVRLHSAIGYVAPADKLNGRHVQIFQDRKRKLAQARFHRAQVAFHDVKQVANL
jgi:transposase InsO family protein